MGTEIPFLSSKSLAGSVEYLPFRNCIAYIKQKSSAIPYSGKGQSQRLELMEKVGMKNYAKFHRRRMEWDNLEGLIPLAYFEAIGVDMKVLSYCLELDNEDYINALSIERKVTFASARMVACFYKNVKTPRNCQDEKDAIEYFGLMMLDPKAHYTHLWIDFPGIIRHTFSRGKGHTGTTYFYPAFTVNNGLLRVKEKSMSPGIAWI
ncbi:MAG TPA: hypothetical protein PK563_11820 [Tenuifilaceae bacterium]|nr:hypothetical protein [Tenuifilaceae bacterium]